METPVYDFVTEYCRRGRSRLHMPGHKGQSLLGCESRDITEIPGADVLHQAEGILAESQENAAKLFGTGRTIYSTEGSSLCIKAMAAALLQDSGGMGTGRPYLLAARNVHRSLVDACALLDLDLVFLGEGTGNSLLDSRPTPDLLRLRLSQSSARPIGVYITSPDYLGGLADIRGLSAVCADYDVPLVVDNAHGAYLRFIEPSVHPMQAGAAMCCDSAHKTLPVLTGGAYLHIAPGWQERYGAHAAKAMAVFGSTSPSYLILQSLDLCNRTLSEQYKERLAETVQAVETLKQDLRHRQIPVVDTEPLKLVLHTAQAGYEGGMIAEEMREHGLECEYADRQYIVCMLTPENPPEDYRRLRCWGEQTVLRNGREPIEASAALPAAHERVCSIREAVFGSDEVIPAEQSAGRICASESVVCPPAVPIAVSGERITPEMVSLFRYYGIQSVSVLANR